MTGSMNGFAKKMASASILFIFILIASTSFAKTPTLIEHAEGDVQYTFFYYPALLIAGGAVITGGLTGLDHSIADHFTTKHLGKADSVADFAGQPYFLDPAAFGLFIAGQIAGNKKLSVTGETLLESLLFTQAVTGALKLGINRTRPNGGKHSFPSSHTSSAFAVATSLQTLYGYKAGIPAYAAASFIGFSRIDKNVHYFSDVFFGAVLGSAIGWGTAHFHKLKHPDIFIVPSLAQGKGLTITGLF